MSCSFFFFFFFFFFFLFCLFLLLSLGSLSPFWYLGKSNRYQWVGWGMGEICRLANYTTAYEVSPWNRKIPIVFILSLMFPRAACLEFIIRTRVWALRKLSRKQIFRETEENFSYLIIKMHAVYNHYNRLTEAILMSLPKTTLFYRRSKRHP